jgi:hypothetical protein
MTKTFAVQPPKAETRSSLIYQSFAENKQNFTPCTSKQGCQQTTCKVLMEDWENPSHGTTAHQVIFSIFFQSLMARFKYI